MAEFTPGSNLIALATSDLTPLLDARPIDMYGGATITVYDWLHEDNEGYPFVILGLGAEATDGATSILINCFPSAYNVPASQELAAEMRRVVREVVDDNSHALRWIRSSQVVRAPGARTMMICEARYPKWR